MLSSGEVINQFKTVIHNIYGDRLDKIVMYGSRARGDFKEDSDFDFLVILKDGTLPASEEAMQVSDFVYELWEKTFLRIRDHTCVDEKRLEQLCNSCHSTNLNVELEKAVDAHAKLEPIC